MGKRQVTLKWNSNPTAEQVTGYSVNRNNKFFANTPTPSLVIEKTKPPSNFTVIAINPTGPSQPSTPIRI